jgi:surface protein
MRDAPHTRTRVRPCVCVGLGAPVSGWNVRAFSAGVDRVWFGLQAFSGASAFNQNLAVWNTASVTTMCWVCAAFSGGAQPWPPSTHRLGSWVAEGQALHIFDYEAPSISLPNPYYGHMHILITLYRSEFRIVGTMHDAPHRRSCVHVCGWVCLGTHVSTPDVRSRGSAPRFSTLRRGTTRTSTRGTPHLCRTWSM